MTRSLFNRSLLLALLLALLLPAADARAQIGTTISNPRVSYLYGQFITFGAQVTSSSPVVSARVKFRASYEEQTRIFDMSVSNNGQIEYTFLAAPGLLRPFSTVNYQFIINLADGQTVESDTYSFRYSDNRFEWKSQSLNAITLYWYGGDDKYALAAADITQRGLARIQEVLQIAPTAPLEIYMYASALDMESALGSDSALLFAGHASPSLGVGMVSIAPLEGYMQEMERIIPHELAHLLLYQHLGASAYDQLPTWLSEGLPSIVELYSSPDYPRALRLAVQDNTLLPMNTLCDAFPRDAAGFFLAYAEAQSFTAYLREQYGTSGLYALMEAYADGMDCSTGMLQATGKNLDAQDSAWRTTVLGENQIATGVSNLIPFVLLVCVLGVTPLISIGLSLLTQKRVS